MEKLKTEHIKAVDKVQQLETIKFSLASEEEYLRKENMSMLEFLKNNDSSKVNQDLSSVVQARDERSEQILDLTSGLKARDDCISLLETKFN